MPKMKTNRTARKKLFTNKNGKVKRGHAYHSHNTAKKSRKRRRKLASMTSVDKTNVKELKRLLPYS
jgi:large subunit ribosomal protein L35